MGRFKRRKRSKRLIDRAIEETGADSLATPEAEKPPEDLTIFCEMCDSDVYKIPNKTDFSVEDFIPTQKHDLIMSNSVYTDCPNCFHPVLEPKYYGGWTFKTREVGEFPSGRALDPGARIPRTHGASPYDLLALEYGQEL